jgi:hypothetical protein
MNYKEAIEEDYKGFIKRSGNIIDNIDRKDMPVYSGVLKYFPNAIKYVAFVSKKGNEQHHPDKPLHWDMDKSTDDPDAEVRHLIDHSINPIDEDGVLHLGKTAWRSLAMLERHLTNNNK